MKSVFPFILAIILLLSGCASFADGAFTEIVLTESGASVSGHGAAYENGVVLIGEGGTYRITGASESVRIVINAKGADVVLILDNASISSPDSAAIFAYKAKSVTISVPEGASSCLTDAESYSYRDSWSSESDEEPDACIYSKCDLIITGPGKLSVTGNYAHAIAGKDRVDVTGADLTLTSRRHALSGKDSLTIGNSVLSVTSGEDGVRTTNSDADMGGLTVTASVINIASGEDGIQSEGALTIESSSLAITSGGGSTGKSDDSAKGIKSESSITVLSGTFALDCADDAVHSAGLLTIAGGTWQVSTSDDAFHSDSDVSFSGGEVTVSSSYEGIEGHSVDISGGIIRIVSSDDGINAAGGTDSGSWSGIASSGSAFTLSGGSVYVNADGDGVDVNGEIHMTGGLLTVSGPSDSRNGALDYDRVFSLASGTLFAAGNSAMAQLPSEAYQPVISVTFDRHLPAGTPVVFRFTEKEYIFVLEKSANNVIFSSPELTPGDAVTVLSGGVFTGTTDGPFTEGNVASAEVFCEMTLEDTFTVYGDVGIGGSMSGGRFSGRSDREEQGGFPGGIPGGDSFPGGFPNGDMTPPEIPEGETLPEMPEGNPPPEPPEDGTPPGAPFPGSEENPFPSGSAPENM